MVLDKDMAERVEAVRRFSRFYTRRIGVLREKLLDSALTLTEARLVWELAHRESATATTLSGDLALDPGYLSRLLKGLEERGLIARRPSPDDGRQALIALTSAGRAMFDTLDSRSRAEIGAMLSRLPTPHQQRVVDSLQLVESLLEPANDPPTPYRLRPHRIGDIGWIARRQGMLYAEEYGWDATFEAMVAEIGARFVREFDPAKERAFVAESDGQIVGSALVVRNADEASGVKSDDVAQLRLVYVEPSTRGLGIGRRMVDECLAFAAGHGYRSMVLWTNDVLVSARRVYEAAGFQLVESEPHHSFGVDLVGQYWEKAL